MKKLELNLDEIRVESFHPAAPEGRAGTVRGHGSSEDPSCTYENRSECVNCNTIYSCNITCFDSCSCGDTDWYNTCAC
jgi:hypothetical protein